MKLEMAILFSSGGTEGTWETLVIDVPKATPNMTYAEKDAVARDRFFEIEEYDSCVGAYLFNDVVEEF